MKKLFFVAFLTIFSISTAFSQLAFGVKGGLNLQLSRPNTLTVGAGDSTTIGPGETKFGKHIGAWLRLGKVIWLQPEVLFNTTEATYTVGTPAGNLLKKEKMQALDLPIFIGIGEKGFRLHGGAVGHYFLNSTSELAEIKGYKAKFETFTWGWQAGFTIGGERFSFDVRYEGNFSKLGEHITVDDKAYHFDKNPARLIASVNYALY